MNDPNQTGERRREARFPEPRVSRQEYWRVGWEAWKERPLTGTGAGTFSYTWLENRPGDQGVEQVHNLYLEQGTETGVFASWRSSASWRRLVGTARGGLAFARGAPATARGPHLHARGLLLVLFTGVALVPVRAPPCTSSSSPPSPSSPARRIGRSPPRRKSGRMKRRRPAGLTTARPCSAPCSRTSGGATTKTRSFWRGAATAGRRRSRG